MPIYQEHLLRQLSMFKHVFLSLQVFVLIFFGHCPSHSFFVVEVLATGPLAYTVAQANTIASTLKLSFFII